MTHPDQMDQARDMIIHNVRDGRLCRSGSWIAMPLFYELLCPADVGRTVIYRDHGRAEAGTLTSWRDGIVFARYSQGDTAAGADASNLVFGLRSLDTPEEIISVPGDDHRGQGPGD